MLWPKHAYPKKFKILSVMKTFQERSKLWETSKGDSSFKLENNFLW